ncbi:MAG: VIT1/CCC1 transporter family protein [Anaerolineae bacterium]|jgi:VIT1/CCC1 family predicted Fe2+/Mn2+ transporter|nr:rubrerythrin family protein [Chloroflexota bacterium]
MTDPQALSAATRQDILAAQRTERTEYLVYRRLAERLGDTPNGRVLARLAQDELNHNIFWKQYTGVDVEPDRRQVAWYALLSRVAGLTFTIKLMEGGEKSAQALYARIVQQVPEAQPLLAAEDEHEQRLMEMIDEHGLRYVGSVVLGLSDAIVELTGTLAGLTLALANTRLIALTGSIVGLSASLSMAASEFLSTQSEQDGREPGRASLYTGIAYVFTVLSLILPYLLTTRYLLALGLTLSVAMLIILTFTYYVSVALGVPFRKRFLQMAGISLGVATLSFVIGHLVRTVFGVDV